VKVTLSIDEQVWLNFKAECTRRKLKPSQKVRKFMEEQLWRWQTEELVQQLNQKD